jgi:quercetin dioxygenase-like cupin family protein
VRLSEGFEKNTATAHEMLAVIAGTPLRVSAGEMVLMPANQPHAVNARTRFKMLLTMIRSV